MLNLFYPLFLYFFSSLSLHALHEFSSDNEHVRNAHSAMVTRVDGKFSLRHSKNPAYKNHVGHIIRRHYHDQLTKSEAFLAQIIHRIEHKDFEALDQHLTTHLEQFYGDAWMMKKVMRDQKAKLSTQFQLNKPAYKKYKNRFNRSLKLGTNLITDATHKAYHEIMDTLDYVRLHKLHQELVSLGIIDGSDDYYALPQSDLFKSKGECSICLEQASAQNPLIMLKGCTSHKPEHCLSCIREYVSTHAKSIPLWHIKCPNTRCTNTVKTCDVLHLFKLDEATIITKTSFMQLQRSHTQFFLCTHEGCQKGFELRLSHENYFTCKHCYNRFCYNCGIENPLGKTCDFHRNINGIGDLASLNVVQICPKCGHGVVRTDGCSSVRCRCGYLMRYVGNFQEMGEKNWENLHEPHTSSAPNNTSGSNEDDDEDERDETSGNSSTSDSIVDSTSSSNA